jgi:pSer/pThr/pTyr-binding forkhead associated (FHA) protein
MRPQPAVAQAPAQPPRVDNYAQRPAVHAAHVPRPAAPAPQGLGAPVGPPPQMNHGASQITCGRCHGVNPPGTRFCQYCGKQLLGEGVVQSPSGYAGGAAAGQHAPAPGVGVGASLVVITQDGTPGRQYPINASQVDIGREEGGITLPHDPYVSPRHARVQEQNGRFFIRDLGALNGIYLRLSGPHPMQHGDLVLIGLEVLRFEFVSDAERNLGAAVEGGTQVFGSPATTRHARLCQRTVEGITRDVYTITREETTLGRESGDVVFTSDPFMSRQHAVIKRDPSTNSFTLRDLGSSNGTYIAIRREVELRAGDHVRIGQHLFRLDIGAGARI